MGMSMAAGRKGGRRRRGVPRYGAMADINMTPFIDIMLVLLIIFMVAAPLLATGVAVDLPGQDRRELVGETLQPRLRLGDVALELVIGDQRRDRGEEADRRRQQRFRNAGRDDGERGVLRRGDRLKRVHDAEHRAEQADERSGGGDGRQNKEVRFEPLDLARDRDVENLVDACMKAAK